MRLGLQAKSSADRIVRYKGRRLFWRFGRYIYLAARGDVSNNIRVNGEMLVLKNVIGHVGYQEPVVLFDIGANIGDWTRAALDNALARNRNVEIHAFEPNPDPFRVLAERTAGHVLGRNVRCINTAVSSAPGESVFQINKDAPTLGSLHNVMDSSRSDHIAVPLISVDSYCESHNIECVHLVKSDVEGHDMSVLEGAERNLQKGTIKVFQFEYNHCWVYARRFLRDVFLFIRPLPYVLGKLTGTDIEIYRNWHPELERFIEGNYVLIHNNTLTWFPSTQGSFDKYSTYTQYQYSPRTEKNGR